MKLRSALAATTALVSVALVAARPAEALQAAAPGGAVFVILPGATATAATVAMAMPNGVPIPIGVLNPTTGLFSPSGLGSETARATAAEASNGTAISAEKSRAQAAEALAIPQSSLGQPGGPASLGSSGTVPLGQLPVTKDATGVAGGGDSRIPTPDANGVSPLLGPDGGTEARVGSQPTNTALENVKLLPGNVGVGGTLLCERPTAPMAAVRCNFVAEGAGGHLFANADGGMLALADPGGPVTSYPTITPGTGTAPIVVIGLNAYGGLALFPGTAASPGGAAIGINNLVGVGPGCLIVGNGGQCRGNYNFGSGNQGYDFGTYIAARFHSSGPIPGGAIGSNQMVDYTLSVTAIGTAASRMTIDGGAVYSTAYSVPIRSNGHGTFTIKAECSTPAGDSATWRVDGSFTSYGVALKLPYLAGVGVPLSGSTVTGGLGNASLSVAADTTNSNLNISVTPPPSNTATLGCTADVHIEQRIS